MGHRSHPTSTRLRIAGLLGVAFTHCALLCPWSLAQDANSRDSALNPGRSLHREIKAAEKHHYYLTVEKGYLVRVVVRPKGVDVLLSLDAEDGTRITRSQFDLDQTHSKSVSAIAPARQVMRLELTAQGRPDKGGTYDIELTALRPADAHDREVVEGEALLWDATSRPEKTLEERQTKRQKLLHAASFLRSSGAKYYLSLALTRIGRNYQLSGEKQTGFEFFDQALTIKRELGDRRGESVVLTFMGFSYGQLGELERALDCHTQALKIRRELHDEQAEAQSRFQIGVVYQRLGDPQTALSYLLTAIPVLRAYKDGIELTRALSFAGAAYASLGQFAQALDQYEQAMVVLDRDMSRLFVRNAARGKAFAYLASGQLPEALELLKELLALSEQYSNPFDKAQILAALGDVWLALGDKKKARQHLLMAVPLMQSLKDRLGEAKAHYLLSRIERDEKNLPAALEQIESTVGLIESVRSRINSRALRISFSAAVENYYDHYLKVLWELKKQHPTLRYDERAFHLSERTRARVLLEVLSESGIDFRQGVSAELLTRERELQHQLNARAEAQTFLVGEGPSAEQGVELAKDVREITSNLEDVQTRIRKQSPRYAALTQPQTLTLEEIQKTLDPNTILLEYKLGPETSYLWVIEPTSFRAIELPARAEIEAQARRFYQLLTVRNRPSAKEGHVQLQTQVDVETQYHETARNLSRILIGPVASALKSQRLIIVSDGALEYIPFAGLPVINNKTGSERIEQSLVVDHEIVNVPSASVIPVLRQEVAARPPAAKALAVFADPVFAGSDVRVAASAQKPNQPPARFTKRPEPVDGKGVAQTNGDVQKQLLTRTPITRLPFSRREARAILAIAAPSPVYAALDFDANRGKATSATLSGYRIVHFATHGWLDSARPELSGVVLSLVDRNGQPQDGVLRLHEIYNLKLNADLVVLSACQTALGKEIRGEGLIGLTRGFMYAGAPRVTATLWRVDDAASAELMTHFYRFMLKEKRAPAAALRAAQLEVMKQKRWQQPYYWAGFVLQGEWR